MFPESLKLLLQEYFIDAYCRYYFHLTYTSKYHQFKLEITDENGITHTYYRNYDDLKYTYDQALSFFNSAVEEHLIEESFAAKKRLIIQSHEINPYRECSLEGFEIGISNAASGIGFLRIEDGFIIDEDNVDTILDFGEFNNLQFSADFNI